MTPTPTQKELINIVITSKNWQSKCWYNSRIGESFKVTDFSEEVFNNDHWRVWIDNKKTNLLILKENSSIMNF